MVLKKIKYLRKLILQTKTKEETCLEMDNEHARTNSTPVKHNNNLDLNTEILNLTTTVTSYIDKSTENGSTSKVRLREHLNALTADNQEIKYAYPKAVFLLFAFELFISYGFYALRSILVIYLTQQLGFSDDNSTIIFHIFFMMSYFLCIFGAIISDSWLGKLKVIISLTAVYVIGTVFVTIGAIPTLETDPITFTIIGLVLAALGYGGMRPCVAAFGGDQFKVPEQLKDITTFFSISYFAIYCGSVLSTAVSPILRQDVHCFQQNQCSSLPFGVGAIAMIMAWVIFMLGIPLYKRVPPAGNMILIVTQTVFNAILTKFRERKINPKEHWLDYSEKKYGKQIVEDVKVLMRILILYLPLTIFWALFYQQGSRWTLQASRMDGAFGSFDIKPDQMQLLNPLFTLIFVPMYEILFYPLLKLIGVRRPLQKLTIGGILGGVAFVISGILELNLEATYPVLPRENNAQLRIFNAEPCEYNFSSTFLSSVTVPKFGYYENKNIEMMGKQLDFDYTITSLTPDCTSWTTESKTMNELSAYGLFLGSKASTNPYWYDDSVEKPSRDALARTLTNLPPKFKVSWKKGNNIEFETSLQNTLSSLSQMSSGAYDILVDNVKIGEVNIMSGGVYTVMITQSTENSFDLQVFTITEPNTINILWLIPQYVALTLGDVMFSITGYGFSYSQAPVSMKSVLQACWLLTMAIGNLIVIIVAEAKLFDSLASEFFLFAGFMFIDMVIFMVLAWRYKPHNPNELEKVGITKCSSSDSVEH